MNFPIRLTNKTILKLNWLSEMGLVFEPIFHLLNPFIMMFIWKFTTLVIVRNMYHRSGSTCHFLKRLISFQAKKATFSEFVLISWNQLKLKLFKHFHLPAWWSLLKEMICKIIIFVLNWISVQSTLTLRCLMISLLMSECFLRLG